MSDAYGNAGAAFRRHQKQPTSITAKRQSSGSADVDSGGLCTSHHSGLSLTLSNGMPRDPEQTAGRWVALHLKRVIDLPLAVVALLALSPMLLGVALAIRFSSSGPALFAQWRIGLNGRPFRMLKFRTLRADACDVAGLDQVVERDGRVTPLGRMLRATSIDELPQLWNVIVGDMAIVGPRPMVGGAEGSGALYRAAVPYYDYRHRVRPGLSGWAQANGLRGPVGDLGAARRRIDHDCAYVQNLSLALDVRIIVRTITREFLTGSGV